MYNKVNPKINKFMQSSPEHMSHGIMMVVLSIQQGWHTVGEQMKDYKENQGHSRYVWGNKARTYKYLQEHEVELFNTLLSPDFTHTYKHMRLTQVVGLGVAKAGFVMQLMFGVSGCMDVHNLRRFDVPASILSVSPEMKMSTRKAKVEQYNIICHDIGTEVLWDTWCDLIAKKHPTKWVDGDHVSMVHYTYLIDSWENAA
jgi:hypothetical protein